MTQPKPVVFALHERAGRTFNLGLARWLYVGVRLDRGRHEAQLPHVASAVNTHEEMYAQSEPHQDSPLFVRSQTRVLGYVSISQHLRLCCRRMSFRMDYSASKYLVARTLQQYQCARHAYIENVTGVGHRQALVLAQGQFGTL